MNPYDAYVNTVKTSMSDREIEAAALSKAALLLKACQDAWDAPDRPAKLAEAVEFNHKLWSILQGSLAQPDHPLPPPLRVDILRLGAYIDKRLFDVLAFPTPEKLAIVIRINQHLASGLRAGPPAGEQPADAETDRAPREEPVWA